MNTIDAIIDYLLNELRDSACLKWYRTPFGGIGGWIEDPVLGINVSDVSRGARPLRPGQLSYVKQKVGIEFRRGGINFVSYFWSDHVLIVRELLGEEAHFLGGKYEIMLRHAGLKEESSRVILKSTVESVIRVIEAISVDDPELIFPYEDPDLFDYLVTAIKIVDTLFNTLK